MQLISTFVTSLIVRFTSLREEANEEGQTLVEYALIIALMSITLVVALALLSSGVSGTFDTIISSLTGS